MHFLLVLCYNFLLMPLILLYFFLFINAFSALGQEKGVLRGKMTGASGEKVEFASIVVIGQSLGTTTDSSGNYFLALPEGYYKIKFSCIGFVSEEKTAKIMAGKTTKLDVALEEMENRAQEVVVTGTMQESYKAASVTPVEIYTPKLFQKNPSPNLFNALQMVNGVRPQLNCNVCNTGDIHINGMEGPYTMVLIDGMPIVSSLSTVYGLMGIPNGIVERIEVVKGPASTLYGSEAVGGVVNVITKNPTKAPTLYSDFNANTWGEYNADLSAKWKHGKVNSLVSLNYFHFKNRIDKNKDGFTDMTLQDRLSIFSKWSFERKENRLATLGIRLLYEDRFGGQTNFRNQFRGTDSVYGESIYTKRAELIGAYQLPFKKQNVVFYYSYNFHDQNSAYGTTMFLAKQHVAFGQLVWTKKLGKSHQLVAGTAIRYTSYTDNTAASRWPQDSSKYQWANTLLPGIFWQDDVTISSKSKLLVGNRLDLHPVHGYIVSPRIGYKLQLHRYHSLRLNTGNGFRVVNVFTEDHAALTGARKVVFEENLEPEKSWNGNVNYTAYLPFEKGFINVDASFFYNYFSNKIIPDYLSDANKIVYKNLEGYAINRGIALSLDINFSNSLKIQLAGTAMEAFKKERYKTGNYFHVNQLLSPNFQGNASVSYTIPYLNVAIDYTSQVYSPMKLPVYPNDYRPAFSPWFSLHNVQISKNYRHSTYYIGIKNIFDFVPQNPILRPFDPFDKNVNDPINNPHNYTFDPNYTYAPLQGIRAYVGLRLVIK